MISIDNKTGHTQDIIRSKLYTTFVVSITFNYYIKNRRHFYYIKIADIFTKYLQNQNVNKTRRVFFHALFKCTFQIHTKTLL